MATLTKINHNFMIRRRWLSEISNTSEMSVTIKDVSNVSGYVLLKKESTCSLRVLPTGTGGISRTRTANCSGLDSNEACSLALS